MESSFCRASSEVIRSFRENRPTPDVVVFCLTRWKHRTETPMGKIENLRPPWKKGESGNPNGRPKRKPITQAYEAVINQRLPAHLREIKLGRHTLELPEGATFADLIALGQAAAAIKGNTAAAEEIANRLEG